MSKFKIGDRIKLKTSGKVGTISAVYDLHYWHMEATEYAVNFDDGAGALTLAEAVIEPLYAIETTKCFCGVASVEGTKHSYYCPLYGLDEDVRKK